ncbi:MAG: Gfo/Idh/MocA family oxidoreductase [Candidatus Dormiibacterota bacterium]
MTGAQGPVRLGASPPETPQAPFRGGPGIRVGVVGCARILPAHLRGIRALRSAGLNPPRITALCARSIEDAARFRRRGEGPAPRPPVSHNEADPLGAPHLYVSDVQPEPPPELFDDWRRLVESDLVDAVLVLAPVALHHQVALAALSAGKHVLIEKPFAITVRAGRAIADEAERRGLVAGVAENQRYAARTRALRFIVGQGLIGRPQLWLSGGAGGEWAPDRIVAGTPWRHRKLEAGGGPTIDVGVHLMHELRMVMGPLDEVSGLVETMEPERVERGANGTPQVRVTSEVEDLFLAQLSFASGAVGSVFVTWSGRGEGAGLEASPIVYGTRGCIKGQDVIRGDGFRGTASDVFERGESADRKERWFPSGVRDSFGLELLDFCRTIEQGAAMEASAQEGVIDLAMAYAVLESADRGRPVRVDQVLSGAEDRFQAEIDAHYRI